MRLGNCHITTTSTLLQLTRKHRHFVSPIYRQRSLCRRTRRRLLTGKERDAETGLYYYGARYLDPRAGRWLSGDPAVSEYIPSVPISEEARKRNGSLPGMGGVFNYANLHVYHYAGNNPVVIKDPNGRIIQVRGEDGTIYTWDNEKNQFYSGRRNNRNYEINDGFVKDVQDSLNYLKSGSEYANKIISDVSSSNRNATIRWRGYTTYETDGKNIRLYFSPNLALFINDDTDSFMSPAINLFHEISHAYSHLVENKLSDRYGDTSVAQGNVNAEEVNAMVMTNRAAQQLGEPLRVGVYTQAEQRYAGSGVNYVRQFRNNQN